MGPSSDDFFRDPFRPLGSDKATHAAATADRGAPADAPREEPGTTPSEPARDAASQGPEKRDPTQRAIPQQRPATPEAAKPGSAIEEAKAPPEPAPTPIKSEAERRRRPDTARAHAAALLAELRNRLGPETPSTPGPQLDV